MKYRTEESVGFKRAGGNGHGRRDIHAVATRVGQNVENMAWRTQIGDRRVGSNPSDRSDFQRVVAVDRTPRSTLRDRYDLCQANVFCLQALRPLLDHK